MSKNNKNEKKKRAIINETDVLDIILNNNDSDDFENIKSQTIKASNSKKIKFFQNYHMDENEENIFMNKLKRCNSVDLYKRHNREKKLKKNQEKNKNKIEDNSEDNKIIPYENNKNGKKIKRVSFLKPKFVTIIDVESYKKYNEQNTSKDPYEEYINNNNNQANNNNNNNKTKKENGKEKVICSCFIF